MLLLEIIKEEIIDLEAVEEAEEVKGEEVKEEEGVEEEEEELVVNLSFGIEQASYKFEKKNNIKIIFKY